MKNTEEKLVIACDHILDGEKPILYIDMDEQERYSFMCGGYDHEISNGKVVHLHHLIDNDDSIKEALSKLEINKYADRKNISSKWEYGNIDSE